MINRWHLPYLQLDGDPKNLWTENHHFLSGGGGGGGRKGQQGQGGWLERKKIKRPINICQTLKCKFPACGPVETQSFIITSLGRRAEGGGLERGRVGRKEAMVFPYLEHLGWVYHHFVTKCGYVINISSKLDLEMWTVKKLIAHGFLCK